jgi:hypothetical protein
MVGGNGGCHFEDISVRLLARRYPQNDMAAGQPPNMEPPVIGSGHVQAQIIVVSVITTGEYDPAGGHRIFKNARRWRPPLRWDLLGHRLESGSRKNTDKFVRDDRKNFKLMENETDFNRLKR